MPSTFMIYIPSPHCSSEFTFSVTQSLWVNLLYSISQIYCSLYSYKLDWYMYWQMWSCTGTCTCEYGVVLVHEQEKTELYWYMYWWTWSCSGTCTGEYGVVLVIMELYWWLWSCTGTCTGEYGVVLVHVLVNMEFYWYTYWRICSCTGTCTGEYGAVLVHVLANMELYRYMYWRT